MKKFLATLLAGLICFCAQSQSIDLVYFNNSVDYFPGGGISLHIKPTGVFPLQTKFTLQLLDETGSKVYNIGSVNEFFVPVLNGTLPSPLAPGSYKLKVVADSAGKILASSNTSSSFNVKGTTVIFEKPNIGNPVGTTPKIDCFNNYYFGFLDNAKDDVTTADQFLEIINYSNGYSYTVQFINHQKGTVDVLPVEEGLFSLPGDLPTDYYTIQVSKQKDGLTSTFSYIFLFNTSNTGFGNLSSENVCVGNSVSFSVDCQLIANNYPSSYYTVNYGDGSKIDTFTHARFMQDSLFIHNYTIATCNASSLLNENGKFKVDLFLYNKGIKVANDVNCDLYVKNGNGTTKYVNTSIPPIAKFEGPALSCINQSVTFKNLTTAGFFGTGSECLRNVNLTWYLKSPKSSTFIPQPASYYNSSKDLVVPEGKFNEKGKWQIKLTAKNPEGCNTTSEYIQDICIEPIPVPDFKMNDLDSVSGCAPYDIKIANKTNANPCRPTVYQWEILDAFGYLASTNDYTISDNAEHPDIEIKTPGKYFIQLTVTNICGTYSIRKPVTILGVTNVALPNDIRYCGTNQTINFEIDGNHKPTYNTAHLETDWYKWTVTGGDYSFENNASDVRYPRILFKGYGTYTVSVTYHNSCGEKTTSQKITFDEPLTADAGAATLFRCFDEKTIELTGSATGPMDSTVWFTSGNGLFANKKNLATTYTISDEDRRSGSISLTLTAFKSKASVCQDVSDQIVVTIQEELVADGGAKTICSGSNVNYAPTGNGTSYNWTSTVSSDAVSGNKTPGSGTIADVLINKGTSEASVTYSIVPEKSGCFGKAGSYVVSVMPVANVTVPSLSPVCSGTNMNEIAFSSSVSNATYQWEIINNVSIGLQQSGNGNIPAFTATNTSSAPITAIIRVTPSYNSCPGTASEFTITVNPRPAQPIVSSPLNCCLNSVAPPLTATKADENTWTWYRKADLSDGVNTPPTPDTKTVGSKDYYVTQTNSYGCTSEASKITVTIAPAIQNNKISGDQTICYNTIPKALQQESGAVTGSTGSITYQWQQQVGNSTIWTNISGATSASYSPGTLYATTKYRRIVYSSPCADTSNVITITVQEALAQFGIGKDQTICEGSRPVLLEGETSTGGDGTYQYIWESSLDQNSWTAVANGTTKDYHPEVLSATTYFQRRVISGKCQVTSDKVTITVNPNPNGNFIPSSSEICVYNAGSVTFNRTAGSWPFDLELEVTGPGGVKSTITKTVSNIGAATFEVIPVNSAAGDYSVVLKKITDSKGCSREGTIATASIKVKPQPALSINPATASICYGSGTTLTVSGATAYTWSAANGLNSTPGNSVTVNPTATTTYTVTGTTEGCSSTASVTITVNPKPAKPSVTQPAAYCLNSTASQLVATPAGNHTLTWYNDIDLQNVVDTIPVPSTKADGTYYFYVHQTNSFGCKSDTARINVVVHSLIAGNNIGSNQTICSGNKANQLTQISGSVTGGGGNYTYQWQMSADNGTSWSNTGTNSVSLDPGKLTVTTMYRRLVYSTSCADTSDPVTITVQEALRNYELTGNQTICKNSKPALLDGQTPTGGNGAPSYVWESYSGTNDWSVIANATSEDYNPGALSQTTYYRRTVTSGQCVITSAPITVTVNPIPEMNVVKDTTVNNGTHIDGITFSSNPNTNVTYAWTNDNTAIGLDASGNGHLPAFRATNNSNPKAPVYGTITVTPTYTFNGVSCPGAPITFKITVMPTVSATVQDEVVCTGTDLPAYTPPTDASEGSTVTYTWEVTGQGISLQNGSGSQIPSYTATNNGTSDISASIKVTPQFTFSGKTTSGTPATYKVTVKPATPAANAGADRTLCAVSEVTMQATQPNGAVGSWTSIGEGGATIANTASHDTKVTGLQENKTYKFEWTLKGFEGCPLTKDTVTITSRPQNTIANAGQYGTICDLAGTKTITLDANADATRNFEKGEWSIAEQPEGANAMIDQKSDPKTKITFNKSGDYKLVWTISNDADCSPSQSTVVIPVYDQTDAGTLSARKDVCATDNVQVTLNSYVGEIYKWQYNPAPVSDDAWRDTTFTGATAVFNNVQDTFAVRVVVRSKGYDNNCALDDITDAFTINVAPATHPGTTSGGKIICQGDGGAVTLTGNTGAIVRWESLEEGTTSWKPIVYTGSEYSYSNLQKTTSFRAVVKSGVCGELYSTETIITVRNPVTKADAGIDQRLCNDPTYGLIGNVPGEFEQGLWTLVSGNPVTISKPEDAQTLVEGLKPGNYVFRWTLSNSYCRDKSDDVTIQIDEPITNIIQGVTPVICFGQQATVTGEEPKGGNGQYSYQWQSSADGNEWSDMQGKTGISLTFDPVSTVYVRRVVQSLPCTSASEPVLIRVQAAISNNTLSSDHQICINTPAHTIEGSEPTGGDGNYIYKWEQRIGNGNWQEIAGATGQHFEPGVLTVTTQFRRTVTTELCSGAQALTSKEVTVTVNPDARAEFVPAKVEACAPFELTGGVVGLRPDASRNEDYEWYVNDRFIGNGLAFPGYTIQEEGDTIVLKLKAISKFGCLADSVSREFKTFIAPKPVIELSTGEGCGPLMVAIGNKTPYASLFTYRWDFGNGQTSNSQQGGNVTFQPNPTYGDTVYIIKLTATSGCEVVSTTREVKVKSKPKAIFSPSKTVGCSPMEVTFNNTSKGIGNRYEWDFGDGFTEQTAGPELVSHTFHTSVQDTFHVRLKAINECGEDVQEYAIVVAPNAIKLDFALNGDEHYGCAPHTVRFINNTKGATGFQWDFGDGNTTRTTKGIDTVRHAYQQPGVYTVQLRAFNGCSDTTSTEVIQVFAKPKATFTASGSTVCLGDTVRFDNTSDDATTYTWRFGDGAVSNLKQPVHFYTKTGVYPVVLITERVNEPGNVCIDSVQQVVEVTATQKGWFEVSGLTSTCAPFTVTFTNQHKPSVTTEWDFGDGTTATGDVVTHTFRRSGHYDVTLTALVPGGCTYVTTRAIDISGPDGTLAYKAGYVCNDQTVRFEATVSHTDSLVWNFGDGTTLRTKQTIVYHRYEKGGSYLPSVTLLGAAQCSFFIGGQDSIKVDKIKAGFTATDDKLCGSTTVQFRDTSFAFFGLSQVQWKLGDGQTTKGSSFQHIYTTTGDYPVQQIVSSFSGCSDTLNRILKVKVYDVPEASIVALDSSCTGTSVTFRSVVQSEDSVSITRWTTSNDLSGSEQQFKATFTDVNTYDLRLVAGTVYGCYDTVAHRIKINPRPVVTASRDVDICRGSRTQLSASGALKYSWSPLGGLSCTTCASPVAAPLVTTPYVVEGKNVWNCPAYDTVVVTVIQPFKMQVTASDSICIGTSKQLVAKGASSYLWMPGAGLSDSTISNPLATPTATTHYRVVGYDNYNCFTDTAFVLVGVGGYSKVSLGADKVLSTGTLYDFGTVIENGPIKTWNWSPATELSCTSCPSPVAHIKRDITYTVQVTNHFKCTSSDTVSIKVFCEQSQVFIPNAFTPDGDGANDILMVRAKGVAMVKTFRIFNRWGEVVFERSNFAPNDKRYAWDGKIRGVVGGPDVFVYTAEVICENGVPFTYKGNVSIIK